MYVSAEAAHRPHVHVKLDRPGILLNSKYLEAQVYKIPSITIFYRMLAARSQRRWIGLVTFIQCGIESVLGVDVLERCTTRI